VLGCSHNSSYTSPSSNDLRRVNTRLIDRCMLPSRHKVQRIGCAHGPSALSAPTHWWVSSTNPRCQPTTHSMHDHEGERRLPGFILTASFSSVSCSEAKPTFADCPSTNRRRDPILRRVKHPSSRRPLWYRNAVLALRTICSSGSGAKADTERQVLGTHDRTYETTRISETKYR
jgi:hypothetical protein